MLKLNKHIIINSLLLVIVLLTTPFLAMAQGAEEAAKKLFDEGKYAEALPLFNDLLKLYPNEPLFQYYEGVCLIESDGNIDKARKLLLQANQAEVPKDCNFYIAKSYHIDNNFETALNYYDRFNEQAKRKEKKQVNFNELYLACKNGENPFVLKMDTEENIETTIEAKVKSNKPVTPTLDSDTANFQSTEPLQPKTDNNTAATPTPASIPNELEIPTELSENLIEFIVARDIVYRTVDQFKTNDGKKWYIEGWQNSQQLKNTQQLINHLREEYRLAKTTREQEEIANKLLPLEPLSLQLKQASDNYFFKAREAEIAVWDEASPEDKEKLEEENQKIITQLPNDKSEIIDELNEQEESTLELEPFDDEDVIVDIDTIKAPLPTPNEPQDKLVYRIQIGAFSKGLPDYIDRLYKKLAVLRKIDNHTDERGVVVYTVGELNNFSDAVKLQGQIRQEGIKDAFAVAYLNGKRITLNEARELEK